MTSYDRQTITYDDLGNQLSYFGWDMAWKVGRQVATMNNASTNTSISYTYNDDGIRTSKTVGDVKTTYTSIDGRITSQTTDTNMLYFRYDNNKQIVGFTLNGTEYLYTLNEQGDVTGILDSSGNRLITYSYDAWGKYTIVSNSTSNKIGSLNPMRYRGYYLDSETGFFYVGSRYYESNTGRLINVNEPNYVNSNDSVSVNLFAYCNNSPVNRIDLSGHKSTGSVFFIDIEVDFVEVFTEKYYYNRCYFILRRKC